MAMRMMERGRSSLELERRKGIEKVGKDCIYIYEVLDTHAQGQGRDTNDTSHVFFRNLNIGQYHVFVFGYLFPKAAASDRFSLPACCSYSSANPVIHHV